MGFDSVFQYEIPYLHPLVVHFPMVLLFLAAGGSTVYLVRGTSLWRKVVMIFLGLGTATAFWARTTGETLRQSVEGTPIVDELVAYHSVMATLTSFAGAVAFVAVLLFSYWWSRQRNRTTFDKTEPFLFRCVLFVLTAFVAAVVAYTAHIGGVMVWGVPE